MQVKLGQQLHVACQRLCFFADFKGERAQNTLDFLALFNLQLAEFVVEFHNHHWLDEDRRAAGRLVVNNAAHLSAALGLDRNDVAVAADSDNGLLQRAAKFVYQGAQAIL